ncbi:MAG TPA: DUF2520 domain-containing protein [Candidatus Dormibacteraeota bacterium]|nr:DUF2520 domain-containing protein [Candidatus Dormibacteraeota bacterium]
MARAFNAAGRRAELRPARKGIPALVRSLSASPDAIVFLAVPDDAVSTLGERLAAAGSRIPDGVAFVHLSGALTLNALDALRSRHPIGSFHPLQSFPEPRSPAALRGIVVAVDASRTPLQRRLAGLARALGARPKHVGDRERVIYHAAAVFASNYVDALLGQAVQLLEAAGWSEREATSGLLALTEGALANVRKRGVAAALTGPVRRGDVTTVQRHLAALSGSASPPLVDLYRMLGLIALEIAVEAGLEPAAAERMHRALTGEPAATRRRRRE